MVPAARRQGVASALLETAMRAAAENDLDLFLDVTDRLRAARALYEHAGFRLDQFDAWSHSNHDQRRNPST